jgi:hypothetical protein
MITIDKIHQASNFVKTNAGFTKSKEFIDQQGAFVPKGLPYHIHYTNDKKEWYMTGGIHNNESKIIIRLTGRTQFTKYLLSKNFELEKDIYLKATSKIPTDKDYEEGSIVRYFARQANDNNANILEISKGDFELQTPFYIKIPINWVIRGKIDEVRKTNQRALDEASLTLPKLRKLISPIQFWKPSIMTIEDIRSSLR